MAALTFDEVTSCTTRTDATRRSLLDNLDGLTEQQIIKTNYAGANTDGALQAMQGLLTANPGVAHWLVYSCNEEGVTGAARAPDLGGLLIRPDGYVAWAASVSNDDPEPEAVGAALTSWFGPAATPT